MYQAIKSERLEALVKGFGLPYKPVRGFDERLENGTKTYVWVKDGFRGSNIAVLPGSALEDNTCEGAVLKAKTKKRKSPDYIASMWVNEKRIFGEEDPDKFFNKLFDETLSNGQHEKFYGAMERLVDIYNDFFEKRYHAKKETIQSLKETFFSKKGFLAIVGLGAFGQAYGYTFDVPITLLDVGIFITGSVAISAAIATVLFPVGYLHKLNKLTNETSKNMREDPLLKDFFPDSE